MRKPVKRSETKRKTGNKAARTRRRRELVTHADLKSMVTVRELSALTSLSDVTLWRMRKRGELPDPIHLTAGRVAWRSEDIQQWIARRAGL